MPERMVSSTGGSLSTPGTPANCHDVAGSGASRTPAVARSPPGGDPKALFAELPVVSPAAAAAGGGGGGRRSAAGRSRCGRRLGAQQAVAAIAVGGVALLLGLARSGRRLLRSAGDPAANAATGPGTGESPLAGVAGESQLFGLSKSGEVFFQSPTAGVGWTLLAGPPCGLVWGKPIDVDASSRAIWVVCEREYRSVGGMRKEHFLFAKWGWEPYNNHAWWHMMKGGDVAQLDADDDAMWGVDGEGGVLWRPSGAVGKHSRWERVDGPTDGDQRVPMSEIAADNDAQGTWLWGQDVDGRLWLRGPSHGSNAATTWRLTNEAGNLFWPESFGKILTIKADTGKVWIVRGDGSLLGRAINGSCCEEGLYIESCWCRDLGAPQLSEVSDTGTNGLGLHFPVLYGTPGPDSEWTTQANRWIQHLSSRDTGHNDNVIAEESSFLAGACSSMPSPCEGLNESVTEFLKGWRRSTHQEWHLWDWAALKTEYGKCYGKARQCRRPLVHFGRFRETYIQRSFCCARERLTPGDPDCRSPECQAYDMTCPGSKLLTSDMDCTVYHSSDPGALILEMGSLLRDSLSHQVRDPSRATLSVVFDCSLFGTWTWIPDRIFQRFPWPTASKELFEKVPAPGSLEAVWVFRRKCTQGALGAVMDKLKAIIAGGSHQIEAPDMDLQLAQTLQNFVGKFARGEYSRREPWDELYQDFRAVARLQREGYLTYPTTLEIVGRQQVGLPARFKDDWRCMRQVSFLEQLVFIAQHVQEDLNDDLDEASFSKQVSRLLMKTGKYFDRLLEVGAEYDEGYDTQGASDQRGRDGAVKDESVLFTVLDALFGQSAGPRWTGHRGQADETRLTSGEVRRRSCMDVAMWGNAARHTDAFRSDAGDLMAPFVQTFFTCFVPSETVAEGRPLKAAILESLESWADAVPRL